MASHVGLPLNLVGGQVEGLRIFWSEEALKRSSWEETEKFCPSRGLFSLLDLGTLFCWVIDGAHWSLHRSEAPGSASREAFKAACAF